jgi:predicted Holliday junction resolvase-like endonuclease
MLVTKTNEEWQKIVERKDAEIQALYKRIKDQQTINDAHKKLNGVLQTDLTEAETKIKNMVEDRLNASRGVLNGD